MYKRKILNRNKQTIYQTDIFFFHILVMIFCCLPRRMSCESVGVGVGKDQKWERSSLDDFEDFNASTLRD